MKTIDISETYTDLQEAITRTSSSLPADKHLGAYDIHDFGTLAEAVKFSDGWLKLEEWINSVSPPHSTLLRTKYLKQ